MEVVFDVFPAISHYNSSFSLAKCFLSLGYGVTYIGDRRYEEYVLQNGFKYKVMTRTYYFPLDREEIEEEGAFKVFCSYMISKRRRLQRIKDFLNGKVEYFQTIRQLGPKLVVIDSQSILNSVFLKLLGVKFILFQSKLSSFRDNNVPPLNAFARPPHSFFSGVRLYCRWETIYLRRLIRILVLRIVYFRLDVHSLATRLLRKADVRSWDFFDLQSDFVVGCKMAPEILTAPRSFDYHRSLGKSQIQFIPFDEAVGRREIIDDRRYLYVKENILSNTSARHVYCSLGTVSHLYQQNALRIYRKVLAAARVLPEYSFIISINSLLPLPKIDLNAQNIFMFDSVPQLDLLQNIHLIISSGGMNTIKECIYHQVPLLIYPVTDVADQPGNAVRVKDAGIGDYGKIEEDSVEVITEKIKSIMFNYDFFKSSLAKLRSEFYPSNEADNRCEFKNLLAENDLM